MQKSYCDICGDEIRGGSLYGGMMRQRKVYPVGSNTLEKINTSQIIPEAIDLCQNCILRTWDFAESLRIKREEAIKEDEAKKNETKKTV